MSVTLANQPGVPMGGKGSAQPLVDETQDPNTSGNDNPRRHVTTRCNRSGVTKITTLLETMYLEDDGEKQNQSEFEVDGMADQLQELHFKIEALENRLKEAVDSTLNREDGLRAVMEAVAKQAMEYTDESLQKFDLAVVACLARRDMQWEDKLKKATKPQRLSWGPIGFSTPALVPAIPHTPEADATITPLHTATPKPPIRMEFPQFGESRSSSAVTDFIEQCENFLTLCPLSDLEFTGTLNAVLKGPAWSWWIAARSRITNWDEFKSAFLEAFLPFDYPSEIEEQLR